MHIIGAGGHAKVIVEICIDLGLEITGLWDDHVAVFVHHIHTIGSVNDFFKQRQIEEAVIAIGSNEIRKDIALRCNNCRFINVIHPSASISKSLSLGKGTVIMPNVAINAATKIGSHCIINTNASIDHDCKIDDFVHVSPNVAIAGGVKIGEGTHIGIGASIIQGINIGKWATIGAGTVIIKDIPDYAVVVGNPGRIIKYNSKV